MVCCLQVEKGTQGVDSRVVNPRSKGACSSPKNSALELGVLQLPTCPAVFSKQPQCSCQAGLCSLRCPLQWTRLLALHE